MLIKDYKAALTKTDKGTYIIKVSDFYKENCGYQDYIEVSEELLDYLIAQRRAEKRMAVKDYRNLVAFNYDDEKMAEMCGKYTESPDDIYIRNLENQELLDALHQLDEATEKRFWLYYGEKLKLKEIAEIEGVSAAAIYYSLKNALEKLRKIMSKSTNESN